MDAGHALHLGPDAGPSERSDLSRADRRHTLADVRTQVAPNLWVTGSHIDLAAAEVELVGVVGAKSSCAISWRKTPNRSTILIVDSPFAGHLTLNALAAWTKCSCIAATFLALHGLSKLLQTIELVVKRLTIGCA